MSNFESFNPTGGYVCVAGWLDGCVRGWWCAWNVRAHLIPPSHCPVLCVCVWINCQALSYLLLLCKPTCTLTKLISPPECSNHNPVFIQRLGGPLQDLFFTPKWYQDWKHFECERKKKYRACVYNCFQHASRVIWSQVFPRCTARDVAGHLCLDSITVIVTLVQTPSVNQNASLFTLQILKMV